MDKEKLKQMGINTNKTDIAKFFHTGCIVKLRGFNTKYILGEFNNERFMLEYAHIHNKFKIIEGNIYELLELWEDGNV